MACWRSSTQSIASYRSSSSAPATPSTAPRVLVAVWMRSPRATASLEPGSITAAASMAHTKSRLRDGAGSISVAMPNFSAVPTTAATCPCGRLRVMSNAPARSPVAGRPLSARCSLSTLCSGQRDRLASVRVFTWPFSRKLSRNSTAGGDPRLGTRVTYMITF